MTDEKQEDFHVRKICKYVGSFAVEASKHEERELMVNDKLEELKKSKNGSDVVLILESYGFMVYDERETRLKIVHSINEVAFITCSPDTKSFAIAAKGSNTLQAHVFTMKKKSHVKEMGVMMSGAFKNNSLSMTTITANNEISRVEANRCWAKKEIARGHCQSEHAIRARRNTSPCDLQGAALLKDIETRSNTSC